MIHLYLDSANCTDKNRPQTYFEQVLGVLIILLVILVVSGCSLGEGFYPLPPLQPLGETSGTTVPCNKPFQLAIIADQTRSRETYGVPPITIKHVKEFIEVLEQCGGELGLLTIQEDSRTPIHRLHLKKKRLQPKLSSFSDPFAYSRAFEQWKSDKKEHELYIAHFLKHAQDLLDESAKALESDVDGNLFRMNSFLNEGATWKEPPEQILVIVSDLQHTAEARIQLKTPPAGVQVLLVHGLRKKVKHAAILPSVLIFESPDSVVRFLKS